MPASSVTQRAEWVFTVVSGQAARSHRVGAPSPHQRAQSRNGETPTEGLSIEITAVDDIRVVSLCGEIDHAVANALNEALLSYGSVTRPRTVADLSGMTFMDSSGINALIAAHQTMSDAQGWLRIAGAQASVLRRLELVGLDQVIGCHSTVEQALTA
ncbi:STAS domain-containing protein [Streptomyces sp. NPDC058676]|uniref:STAS domain-containing protein n=1 Tax=unclassified Streptomyces TaxID=2593676 RepID=UPI003664167C